MPEFDFTLAIEGGLTPNRVDALFEMGCDDMTFQGTDIGPGYVEVSRNARSFFEAVVSAIRDVEKVDGLLVEAIDAGGLVTMAEIADRLGRSRESVRLLISGGRGPGGFPPARLR